MESAIHHLQSKAVEQSSSVPCSSQWSVDSQTSAGDESEWRSDDELVDVSHRTKSALEAWQKLVSGMHSWDQDGAGCFMVHSHLWD